MKILGLDLARQTGWACGEPCALPVYGTLRLDAATEPARFLQLGRMVTGLIQQHGVTAVVIEQPHVSAKFGFNALMPLFGYRAAALMAAESRGVPVNWAAGASTVRKHFIGAGGLKREAAKAAVVERCRQRGWNPKNDDEADALALLDWRLAVLDPNHLIEGMKRWPIATSASASRRGSART